MLVTKVFPRTAPYIMAAVMTAGLGIASLKAAQNDSFEKVGSKAEIVKSEKAESKEGIPWLNIIGVGGLLAFFGLIKLGEYIDKKLDEEDAKKAEKTEHSAENVLPADEPVVKD